MLDHIIEEIQHVVDKLHQEGHVIATRLENALGHLVGHVKDDSAKVADEVKTEVEHVVEEEKPVVEEVKAEAAAVADEIKTVVEKDLAEAVDVATKTAPKK